jgi:hypothetical protein
MFTPRIGARRPPSRRAAWMRVPSPPRTTTRSALRPTSASSVTTSTPFSRRNCSAKSAVSDASTELTLWTMPTRRGTGHGWPSMRGII